MVEPALDSTGVPYASPVVEPCRFFPLIRELGRDPTTLAGNAAILYNFSMPDRKRTSGLDWEDVRYFVALARHRSLSAAARSLRVNHATVSRRVAGLEAALGCALFDRGLDGYVLTHDGKAVLDQAVAMEEAASAVLRRVNTSSELTGLVRLTSGRTLAEWFLVERLDGLRSRHPTIDIELVGDVRLLSLARREADIALRFGAPKSSETAARRVGTITFGLFVASSLRDEPNAMARLPLIGFDREEVSIAEAEWLERSFPGRRFAFRGSQPAQAAAARAGFGVALLPRYLAAGDPRLAEIVSDIPLLQREIWLLIRPELKTVRRIRAVADYLIEVFRREPRYFARTPEHVERERPQARSLR
jgi:DNA-binding transcriptional LysR family regulator